MTKQAFLDALNERAAALPESERARLIAYFTEIIDDSIEEGVPEEQAVAALGSLDELLRELAPAGAKPAQATNGETVDALRSLNIRVKAADVTIRRAPLENGAAAQVRFSSPERFTCRMDGDTLSIEEKDSPKKYSFLGIKLSVNLSFGESITVTLGGALDGALNFAGHGGNLTVGGLQIGESASLSAGSGDITLTNVECGGSFAANCGSGDIELRALCCADLRAVTGSGDIELDRCQAASALVKATSGDVRLDEVGVDGALCTETTSGDIGAARCVAGEMQLKTVSGDIDAAHCDAPQMQLDVVSGDIEMRLPKRDGGWDLHADTRSGDISLPKDQAPAGEGAGRVFARTTSGDIDISVDA